MSNDTLDELTILLLDAGIEVQHVGGDIIVRENGKNVQLSRRDGVLFALTPAGESFLHELRGKKMVPRKVATKGKQA